MLSVLTSPQIILALFLILFVWIVLLTIFYVRQVNFYKKLFSGTDVRSLEKVLNNLQDKQQKIDSSIKNLILDFAKINSHSLNYFYKTGLVRFNPFSDTGGQQSFAMAILNEKKTGIVLSHLFGRQGSRWYVKQITEGKSMDLDLTDEEKEAIKKAQ